MKFVMQHLETRLYLQPDKSWNRSVETALTFPSSAAALDFCQREHISHSQMIMHFADSSYDTAVPVRCGDDANK